MDKFSKVLLGIDNAHTVPKKYEGFCLVCINITLYVLPFRVFKKGFLKKRTKGEDEPIRGYPSQWLSWIRPEVFPRGKTT